MSPRSKMDVNENDISQNLVKATEKPIPGSILYRQFWYVNDFGIAWRNVIFFAGGHVMWLISLYYALNCKFATQLWNLYLSIIVGLGVTAGAHRLWAHRSYKAKFPLRLFLAIGQSIAGQNCIYIWARDHRVHHKFSDTNADPHNILRGVFFSHVGWLLHKKHPEVIIQGKKIPLQDLLDDPIVYYQMVFYYPIYAVFAFCLPILIPYFFWDEPLITSFFVTFIFRQMFTLHSTWFVNSAAHVWGDKPYDPQIHPVENRLVSFFSMGEGFHNYHHSFPWDYGTGELGNFPNWSRRFIEVMAYIGQAYDLKQASPKSVGNLKLKSGQKSFGKDNK